MCILSVALKSLWQQTVPTRVGISSVFPSFLFFSYPGDTSTIHDGDHEQMMRRMVGVPLAGTLGVGRASTQAMHPNWLLYPFSP
jgi:hypothetical protein